MSHITIELSARDTIAELREAIRNSNDEAQKTRIRAIISIKSGISRSQTVRDLVINKNSILAWVRAYNEGGTTALHMSKGGRSEGNPTWDPVIFEELTKEISKNTRYWSIPLMQKWISKQHKKEIPESTIWYHLKIREMSYKSARPSPYKGDKDAQDVFKKGV